MARTMRARKRTDGRAHTTVPKPKLQIAPTETKPVRGMKLKTVSLLTLLFAVVCLGAFLAGRPPLSAAGASANDGNGVPMFIGLRAATYPVRNLAEAKAWYSRVLGVPAYIDEPSYVGFRTSAGELDLLQVTQAQRKQAASEPIYWGVSDAKAAYRRLIELGAKPGQTVRTSGEGILAGTVEDPFGNTLVVVQNSRVHMN